MTHMMWQSFSIILENALFQIAEGNIKREVAPINEVIKVGDKGNWGSRKKRRCPCWNASGFTKLDRLTSGWQKSELVIIAARPSMGKTAFALSMARNMAIDHGKKVAIFSCEMSSIQLVNRLNHSRDWHTRRQDKKWSSYRGGMETAWHQDKKAGTGSDLYRWHSSDFYIRAQGQVQTTYGPA